MMDFEASQVDMPPVRPLQSHGPLLISSDLSLASWGGLFYLALFLCSKFAIAIPFLPIRSTSETTGARYDPDDPLHFEEAPQDNEASIAYMPYRNRAAAPPVYLLALPLVPISAAIYITATRFFQFYHHGFDLIFGSGIGIISAWFSFRLYHLPVSRGAGWSWGARSRNRAWAIGVGQGGYVGNEGWSDASARVHDPEKARLPDGGLPDVRRTEAPNASGAAILGPGLPGPLENTEIRTS
jgi:hypothetical protein